LIVKTRIDKKAMARRRILVWIRRLDLGEERYGASSYFRPCRLYQGGTIRTNFKMDTDPPTGLRTELIPQETGDQSPQWTCARARWRRMSLRSGGCYARDGRKNRPRINVDH